MGIGQHDRICGPAEELLSQDLEWKAVVRALEIKHDPREADEKGIGVAQLLIDPERPGSVGTAARDRLVEVARRLRHGIVGRG